MIKFFRKIRQNLLMENKTGKYFKYAIGEIVLVVIGILIALQINNANENRKISETKKEYYRQILLDLDKEIDNINTRIILLDTSIVSLNNYFQNLKNPNLKPIQLIKQLKKVEFNFEYISFNSNTTQTLESTGEIKIIPKNIRNLIIELKREQELISQLASGNYDIYLNAQQKALQLGFVRLFLDAPENKALKIENNFSDIVLTLEGGFILKRFTDKMVKESLSKMLEGIKSIKEMISVELK
jgi:predicted RNase H-like nuclease (RuvC/YqgF family)